MKKFTKKRGFFTVSAALLIVIAMLGITGCNNDISNVDTTDNFTPPTGKGAVRLNFNENIARTILPEEIDISDFDSFDFVFTATGGDATSYTESNILSGSVNNPITLDPGNYSLTVIAYLGSNAAAKNDPPEIITITAAKVTNATIQLKPYDQATGSGTFKYEVTSSIDVDDIDSADMKLSPIFAGSTQSDVTILTAWNTTGSTISLTAGDYYVDFVITVKTNETVTFRHIVHIYQNMTSSYVFTINPDYFNAFFELTDLTYLPPEDLLPVLSTDGGATGLAEGTPVTVMQGDTVTITVKNASLFTSFEWYCLDDTSLGASDSFNVKTGIGEDFHARKTYLLTVVGVTATKKYYTFINIKVVEKLPLLSDDGGSNVLTKGATVNVTSSVTISVTNTASFDSYEWYNGNTLLSETSASYIVIADTADGFNNPGTYTLTVKGVKGSTEYSTFIYIDVQ